MGRKSSFIPKSVREGWWHVVRDAFGECRIRDAQGFDPLRHPDPLVRLRAVYRAAAAEALAYALGLSAERLMRAAVSNEEQDFACWLYAVLYESVPLAEEEARVSHDARQVHLYFDEAA